MGCNIAYQAGGYRLSAGLEVEAGPVDAWLDVAEMPAVVFDHESDERSVARIHAFVDELERFIGEQSAVVAQTLTGPPITAPKQPE